MVTRPLATLLLLLAPAILQAQSETTLRDYFEGRTVKVKIAMPGTEDGVDIYPGTAKPLDFPRHASRLKSNGTALRAGDDALVTKVKVKSNLIEFQLDNLADAAARLGALEGQKHVLFFTEGFDSTRITDIKVKQGPPQVNDRLLGFMKRLHETFASAGVMLDTIDIKGLRHTFADLENEALYELARGTGGRVVANRNDLVEALDSVTTAQSVVYVLGFHPGDRKRGKISVRVNGLPRGSEVTHREGFGYVKANGDVDALRLADVLTNDIPQSGLRIGTRFEPRAGGAELELALFPQEIAPQLVEKTPYVDVLLYVFDAQGATVMAKSERVKFDARLKESKDPIVLRGKLDAPPGRYVVKAIAHVAGTQSLGFAKRDLEVTP